MLTPVITVYLEATHQIHIGWYNAGGHKRLPIPGLETVRFQTYSMVLNVIQLIIIEVLIF